MRLINERKLDFSDVLIVPKRSEFTSRKEVELERTYKFKWSSVEYRGIPIMASNMEGVGTRTMADVLADLDLFTVLHKSVIKAPEKVDTASYAWTIGLSTEIPISYGSWLCLDVANGYQEQVAQKTTQLRQFLGGTKTLIVGNVVTPEMTEALLLAGADIVKIGLGSGSACATRTKTGVGYPQLSAVVECADAAHGLGGHIISDGGCRTPGDVVKAFAAGADFVMLGGMLAGHKESELEPALDYPNEPYIRFHGNAYYNDEDYKTSEGTEILVPFRGPVVNTVNDILGGIRSACSYVGAHSLKELSKRTTFIRIG